MNNIQHFEMFYLEEVSSKIVKKTYCAQELYFNFLGLLPNKIKHIIISKY